MKSATKKIKLNNIPMYIILCGLFFIAFSMLSIIKHDHYLSGYDLSIINQITWKYSQLKEPITTVHAYSFTSIFNDHIEFIYILFSPLYRIFNNALLLIWLQNIIVCSSGIAVYLIAKNKKINELLALTFIFSYFTFYGVQNALWSDVHSLAFGAAFLTWLIYSFEVKNNKLIVIFFLLTIICKEDMAMFTFLISLIFFLRDKRKLPLFLMAFSIIYLAAIFFIYFPHFTEDGYRFSNGSNLLSNISIPNLWNTEEKKQVIFYSLGSFGFLSLGAPLYLINFMADLGHYFIFGSNVVTSAQGLFMHYRITLSILLIWPVIIFISKYKKLNTKYTAFYLLICACFFQYFLHLPLSYLTKQWFWTEPLSVSSINNIIKTIPENTSIATQVNISPHLSNRDNIFTIWPTSKEFANNSPCGKTTCNWLKWAGKPEFMFVDLSDDWDIRHYLANKEDFFEAVNNMEKTGIITIYKQEGTTKLYKIIY